MDHVADIPLPLAKSIVGFKHDETNLEIDQIFGHFVGNQRVC